MNTHRPLLRLGVHGWFFWALLVSGYAYVSMGLCHRAVPISPWKDWLAVTLSGPALFIFAGQHAVAPFADVRAAFFRNILGYGLPFVAGLHFQWIEDLTGAHFALTMQSMSRLTKPDMLMLSIAGVVLVVIGSLCLQQAKREGILRPYLSSLGAVVVLVTALVLVPSCRERIHIHHYFWALSLIPFVRFQHPLCAATQAFLVGVYVEGAARWGISPIWDAPPVHS